VFRYEALPCPDFRKSQCKRGDACPYGHGVFECWLHPSKYRTTLCKEGAACTRSVCFFAHSLEQLREPTTPAANKSTAAHSQRILQLPPIVTTRSFSALKALSSPCCCEINNPNSPGSILQQQRRGSSSFSSNSSHCGHGAFSLLSTTTTNLSCTSSVDTSRCVSPGASIAAASTAAATESFCRASLSVPSSVDSSLASTPVISEAVAGLCLPASLDTDSENIVLLNKHATNEKSGCSDVAMAAVVALRAQQQQAASAAAAAQVALTRILQTASANGLTVTQPQSQMQCSSLSAHPPQIPSLSNSNSAISAAIKKQDEQKNEEEFALQQLMAGLGL